MLADRRYSYLLTVTNHAFRYLLVCEATESNAENLPLRPLSTLSESWAAAGHPFLRPRPVRFPMVCSTSPRVSVLWLRVGISLERIKPGHSQQNSRHERRQPQPAGANIVHEQAEFDDFIEKFNHSWFCLLFARLKRRWWRDSLASTREPTFVRQNGLKVEPRVGAGLR
jgi:putative transposase